MALNGNTLIGVGLTTLGQVCRLLDADDLEGLSKAVNMTLAETKEIGVENALGWASACLQLANQDDADALQVQTATAGDGDASADVSWAGPQGMIAVCALLFVVGHLVALVRAYARPQQAPGAPIGAAEGDGEDDEDERAGRRASVTEI